MAAMMPINENKQSERWKRNKRAERARKSPYPQALSREFAGKILRERDRRVTEAMRADAVIRPGHAFHEPGSYERAIRFAADVWAADTWLREEWGPKGPMPRRVAAWLKRHGAPHGYTEMSLPRMIRKARARVELLEQPQPWNWGRPIWAPFNPIETTD